MSFHEELVRVPVDYSAEIDIYSGLVRKSGATWARLVTPSAGTADTVFLFVHPTSSFLGHYALEPLAARGYAAAGLATRYSGNDSSLLIENCVLDVGSAIRVLRDKGYANVVLVGNSGGGGLAAYYQSQATKPTVTHAPGGDGPDLTQADLPAADALVMLMAHPGRAIVYTEWLDAAIVDEDRPWERDPELDMFSSENGPPYSEEFLGRYRQAQLDRSERIRQRCQALIASDSPYKAFVVQGTCADPRFLDLSLDPSDREPGTLWGDAWQANFATPTLGRYASARSWLSQWSYADSNGDSRAHLPHVEVPVAVIYGSADTAAFPSHAASMHEAVAHANKELICIPGATHYFTDQADLVETMVTELVAWVHRACDSLRGRR